MSDFCLIRPASDAFAAELSVWCSNLKPHITGAGHSIQHDLSGTSATRTAVDSAIPGMRCVVFFGHGSYTELLGANGALVDTANVAKAKNSILVAIACSSAKVLGLDATNQGADVYLGFSEKFVWISGDPDGQFEPAAKKGLLTLLARGDAGQALTAMAQAFDDVKNYYLNGAGKGSTNSTAGWLSAYWDSNHVTLIGPTSTTL